MNKNQVKTQPHQIILAPAVTALNFNGLLTIVFFWIEVLMSVKLRLVPDHGM